MNENCLAEKSLSLEDVQRHFERWRVERRGLEAIPDRLWSEAVALCREHSVRRVARALRLNSASLKERVERSPAQPEPGRGAGAAFVELNLAPGPGPRPSALSRWSLEVEEVGGTRLRLSCEGSPPPDVPDLLRGLLGLGS